MLAQSRAWAKACAGRSTGERVGMGGLRADGPWACGYQTIVATCVVRFMPDLMAPFSKAEWSAQSSARPDSSSDGVCCRSGTSTPSMRAYTCQ
jgi:hypothetical protein